MNFINFIKDCIKQAIENKEDFLNQIKGDTVLSWCNRIIIVAFFFSFSLFIAFFLSCILPEEYAISITVAFTFINGVGIFIIRTADRKKEFNDKKQEFDDRKQEFKDALFSQRSSRLLDAIKLISQESEKVKKGESSGESDGLNQGLIRFAFSELSELRKSSDFEKKVDCFTSLNHFRKFNLSDLDLSHFNFNGTKLQGVYLIKAKLKNANLKGANLTGAYLRDADLEGADFSNAVLYRTDLIGSNWELAKWDGANLDDAIRCDADVQKFIR